MNFMMLLIQLGPARADYGGVNRRSFNMKWETPQAIEFRFGMEITMYVANR
jgi:coenzyme PQQ precursor peptide PqqA